jgi:glycosyltransferase involved in cell wall biosynthesis
METIYVFFAVLFALAFVVQIFYYLYFFTGVLVRNSNVKKGKITFQTQKPPVSVIICAKNEQENLEAFLPLFLEQDYPDFEVIVVNDGSQDDTETVLNSFSKKYSNLYFTTLSNDVKVLSPKKLAVTVGIKAAKNEILLFSDADCCPQSKDWISLMVRNFLPKTEFVLGFGDYFSEKKIISHLISFDTLFIAMQYLGFAFRGFPYMGIGRNMAYRKATFFRMRGFAGHLHVVSGDDDLIVNSAGNRENTQIECVAESKTLSLPKRSFFQWIAQKRRHLSAAPLYSAKSKQILGAEVLSRGFFYIFFLLLLLTQNLFFIIFSLSLFLVRYSVQLAVVNLASKHLGSRKFFLSIIFWEIVLPLISLYLSTLDKIFYNKKRNGFF